MIAQKNIPDSSTTSIRPQQCLLGSRGWEYGRSSRSGYCYVLSVTPISQGQSQFQYRSRRSTPTFMYPSLQTHLVSADANNPCHVPSQLVALPLPYPHQKAVVWPFAGPYTLLQVQFVNSTMGCPHKLPGFMVCCVNAGVHPLS